MTCHYLPRTETSFSRWKCERKGRREGDNRRPFPSSLAVHHHVTRVSRSPLRREKRSAWGGSWFTISIWEVPTIGWSKFPSRMTNQNTDWTSFGGVTSGDVGKCRMLSKATDVINWGGAWWDWVELHHGIVLGDKSAPEQKHITNFMKRTFLLSTTFFSKYSDSYDEPWLITTNHHFESNFSSSMQKIRIQFSMLKQPRESHCKNENSQSSPGCNSMQHRPALTRAT